MLHTLEDRPCCVALIAALFSASFAVSASAQDWPARNITAIVPLGAGSASDIVARVVMEQVGKQLGQTVVVENRPGAGGTIGANMVAKAAPDGYTILIYGAIASAHALYSKLPYDSLNDFVPVMSLGQQTARDRRRARQGIQDARRSHRGGQGQARFAELLDRGRRVGIAFRRRAFARERRLRGAAHSVQGRGRSRDRRDRRTLGLQRAACRRRRCRRSARATSLHSPSARTSASACCPMCRPRSRADLPPSSVYPFYTGMYLPAKTPPEIVAKLYQETAKALDAPAVKARLAHARRRADAAHPARVREVHPRRHRGERRAGEGGENPDAVGCDA